MTKKDYVLIAEVLNKFPRLDYGVESVLEELAEEMADALALTNPRFDRAKFLTACGVN